jgi:hypothetical protein
VFGVCDLLDSESLFVRSCEVSDSESCIPFCCELGSESGFDDSVFNTSLYASRACGYL